MSDIDIDNFPDAFYDPDKKLGYLVEYIPFNRFNDEGKEEWKKTQSPKILNYKEGSDKDIKHFVKPFGELIKQTLVIFEKKRAFLIPVPSSIPKGNLEYITVPLKKSEIKKRQGEKKHYNRDDRNIKFCELLVNENQNLKIKDILNRVQRKEEKDKWSACEHKNSFKLVSLPKNPGFKGLIFLVDDIFTSGHTMEGAEILLKERVPNATIIKMVLGCTS